MKRLRHCVPQDRENELFTSVNEAQLFSDYTKQFGESFANSAMDELIEAKKVKN